MIRIYFTVLLLTITFGKAFSQDTLIMKNGEVIPAKILEIAPAEIRYNRFDYLDGPIIVVAKTDVTEIIYENGKRLSIVDDVRRNDSLSANSSNELYFKGQKDARLYYHGYSTAGTVTLITSLLYVPAGLIPAIICSSTKPKDENLNMPRKNLTQKEEYLTGYKYRAKKIKQGKVWLNFSIGLGANIIAYIYLQNK